MKTNRDLYHAIYELRKRYISESRTLEHYLSALLPLVRRYRTQTDLSLSEFYGMIAEAFTAEPAPFLPAWRDAYGVPDANETGFTQWEATVIRQIVDLREMKESGTLANKLRYFGINAPRGARWYNFDPITYLECAAAGSFDGWQEGDDTGRRFVPGEFAMMDAAGNMLPVDPGDMERAVYEMRRISWEQFTDFVECGQMYE